MPPSPLSCDVPANRTVHAVRIKSGSGHRPGWPTNSGASLLFILDAVPTTAPIMTTPLHLFTRAAVCAALGLPALAWAQAPAASAAASPVPLLRQLDGDWRMSGDVRGKPVTYRMTAEPALQGTFTALRMKDVQVPAQYEAVVYIGYDAASKTVIAHWMDSFGPKYSIPHGTGQIDGDTIQFVIPYATGPFRNTWRYDPAAGSWQFSLESGQPDGTWKHFARYKVKRD
ncbi:hypothetical protein DIR46_10145 [Massilia oculi]|uniref:DUF1579 domain-containing protein n=2 Tax=Massilia oculi TaxID=945844 RepID=A0A2S2DIR8_9BURK|nr:hypothetical protein DIR46_10145 [Massilia oculi]